MTATAQKARGVGSLDDISSNGSTTISNAAPKVWKIDDGKLYEVCELLGRMRYLVLEAGTSMLNFTILVFMYRNYQHGWRVAQKDIIQLLGLQLYNLDQLKADGYVRRDKKHGTLGWGITRTGRALVEKFFNVK